MTKNFPILRTTLAVLLLSAGLWSSCKHDPVLQDVILPADPAPSDPTDSIATGAPCDPDLVYFDLQVLPILRSNCAFSDCHNFASAEEGVILESYETVMQTAGIKPFNAPNSKLYKALVTNEADERMPRAPADPLTNEQIQLIYRWIDQGAQDLSCDPDAGICQTDSVSYSQTLAPVFQNSCVGCHSGANPSGGLFLGNYQGIRAVADDGRLQGALRWDTGYAAMPQGGNKMPDCFLSQIQSWIDAGAPEN